MTFKTCTNAGCRKCAKSWRQNPRNFKKTIQPSHGVNHKKLRCKRLLSLPTPLPLFPGRKSAPFIQIRKRLFSFIKTLTFPALSRNFSKFSSKEGNCFDCEVVISWFKKKFIQIRDNYWNKKKIYELNSWLSLHSTWQPFPNDAISRKIWRAPSSSFSFLKIIHSIKQPILVSC